MIRLFHSILVDSNKEDAANLKLKVSVWNPRNLLPSWKQGNMDDTDVKMKIQLVRTCYHSDYCVILRVAVPGIHDQLSWHIKLFLIFQYTLNSFIPQCQLC